MRLNNINSCKDIVLLYEKIHLNGKLSTERLTACPLFIFSQVHLLGRAPSSPWASEWNTPPRGNFADVYQLAWVPSGISPQKEMQPCSHVQQLNDCKEPDLSLLAYVRKIPPLPGGGSLTGPQPIVTCHHHRCLGFFPRTEHEQTFSLLGFLGWTRGPLSSYSFLQGGWSAGLVSSNPTLTARWICSLLSCVQILGHICKLGYWFASYQFGFLTLLCSFWIICLIVPEWPAKGWE